MPQNEMEAGGVLASPMALHVMLYSQLGKNYQLGRCFCQAGPLVRVHMENFYLA